MRPVAYVSRSLLYHQCPEQGLGQSKTFNQYLSECLWKWAPRIHNHVGRGMVTAECHCCNRASAPWGSWAHRPFCVPHCFFLGSKPWPPGPPLSSKGQVQTVANRGKGGDAEAREEPSRNDSGGLGQVLAPPPGTQTTISLSSSTEGHRPTHGRCAGSRLHSGKTTTRPPDTSLEDNASSPIPDPYLQPRSSPPVSPEGAWSLRHEPAVTLLCLVKQ